MWQMHTSAEGAGTERWPCICRTRASEPGPSASQDTRPKAMGLSQFGHRTRIQLAGLLALRIALEMSGVAVRIDTIARTAA